MPSAYRHSSDYIFAVVCSVGRSWVHYRFRSEPSRCTFRAPHNLCGLLHARLGSGLSPAYNECGTYTVALIFPEFTRILLIGSGMTKIEKTCLKCGTSFLIYPARQRDADKRGLEVKFCSRACTDKARADGDIKGNPRRGVVVPCATCGTDVYKKQKAVKRSKMLFCSEACRVSAISGNRIDRKFEQASEKKRTGVRFECCICGTEKYQRISYYVRGVSKTCGNPDCVSAYSRSLWNLPPFEGERKPKSPSRRATNFTAKQRAEWMGDKCAMCGTSENLCLDHKIPVCAGGLSVKDNAQTLCQPCNNWKMKHFDRPFARAVNNSN